MRSLYLQHQLGDITDADSCAMGRHNVNKENEKWHALKGTIPQDAYGRLITSCEKPRKAQPDLF